MKSLIDALYAKAQSLGFVKLSLGMLLATVAYYSLYFNYGIDLDDEGALYWGAHSVAEGLLPVVDFSSYQPWMYLFLGGFYKLFGVTLVVERLFLAAHLLIGTGLLLWIGRKMLPEMWAFVPAALYAIAPGPWYKLFFIFHIILAVAATLRYAEKPRFRTAFWCGAAVALAGLCRIEAGAVMALLFVGAFALVQIHGLRCDPVLKALGGTLRQLSGFLLGVVVPLALCWAFYAHHGKAEIWIQNTIRYSSVLHSFAVDLAGGTDRFSLLKMLTGKKEHLCWGLCLAASMALFFRQLLPLWTALREKRRNLAAEMKIIMASAAILSMSYTYDYVWNSRILSSFAIVYVAVTVFVLDIAPRLAPKHPKRFIWGSLALLLFFVTAFCKTGLYSGSITGRHLKVGTSDIPFLAGSVVDARQLEAIDKIRARMVVVPNATFVAMSEATGLGYLTGAHNPTYYRWFLMEFHAEGEVDRAIEAFEKHKIDFLVARTGQFYKGGARSSDISAYAPRMFQYILDHYDLERIGENYVLLKRKPTI